MKKNTFITAYQIAISIMLISTWALHEQLPVYVLIFFTIITIGGLILAEKTKDNNNTNDELYEQMHNIVQIHGNLDDILNGRQTNLETYFPKEYKALFIPRLQWYLWRRFSITTYMKYSIYSSNQEDIIVHHVVVPNPRA